jgi:intron-binding protein aquarius
MSQLQILNSQPLYPNEEVLWDEHQIPSDGPRKFRRGHAPDATGQAGGEEVTDDITVALLKLNLQFLTIHDYLLRNFVLFRLESAYEIRQDLEDVIKRVKPVATTVCCWGGRTREPEGRQRMRGCRTEGGWKR